MKIFATKFEGLFLIQPKIFDDARGFFFESFKAERYAEMVALEKPLVQMNCSRSQYGVLRGLHYQLSRPQAKLITIIRGKVIDVVVDIRQSSATFGQSLSFELSDQNHYQLFIPEGFAHGFVVLSPEVDFFYACTDYYDPHSERGVYWNDPSLNIKWMIEEPILSAKDKTYPLLKDIPYFDLPQ